jgi:hypothetical protein
MFWSSVNKNLGSEENVIAGHRKNNAKPNMSNLRILPHSIHLKVENNYTIYDGEKTKRCLSNFDEIVKSPNYLTV